jgi:hypothetical protein
MPAPDFGFARALRTLTAAKPALMFAMRTTAVEGKGALDLNQPELNEGFCRIAAKLAMGLYYEEKRRIASSDTLINAFWTHNQRKEGADLVPKLLGMFPTSQQLKQGMKDTGDSFFIRSCMDGPTVQVAAVFYESVALMAAFDDSAGSTEGPDWQFTFTPDPSEGIKTVSADGCGGRPGS